MALRVKKGGEERFSEENVQMPSPLLIVFTMTDYPLQYIIVFPKMNQSVDLLSSAMS